MSVKSPRRPAVRNKQELEPYRARDVYGLPNDQPLFGKAWDDWLAYAWHYMFARYPWHAVRSPIALRDIIKLCAATHDYLYTRHTPRRVTYTAGDRPILEELLSRCIFTRRPGPDEPRQETTPPFHRWRATMRRENDDWTMACRIADWAYWELLVRGRVLQNGRWHKQIVIVNTLEEIISFHGRMDTWNVARVTSGLLKMMGIPARLALMFADKDHQGRAAVECCCGGVWRLLDVSANVHYLTAQGEPASLWQVSQMRRPKPQGQPDPDTDITADAFDQTAIANLGREPAP